MSKVVYSPKYEIDVGAHIFPMHKYRLIKEKLIKEKIISRENILEPDPAHDEDILLVHTPEYLEKLSQGTLSVQEMAIMELPYSQKLKEAARICVGGSILAGELALQSGVGMHLGGGFHHAFPDHGEGFCMLNDIAIAIRKLQKDKKIKKALVVDCDLHQGNGTAAVFAKDRSVYTFSMHQENNYPMYKPPSDLDIGLEDGTGDDEYVGHLEKHVPRMITGFGPELLVYVAGADPYEKDQLGGLALTMAGLQKRDEAVISQAKKNGLPLIIVLAGGYALIWKIRCRSIARLS